MSDETEQDHRRMVGFDLNLVAQIKEEADEARGYHRRMGRPRHYTDRREWLRVQLPVALIEQLDAATANRTAFIEAAIRQHLIKEQATMQTFEQVLRQIIADGHGERLMSNGAEDWDAHTILETLETTDEGVAALAQPVHYDGQTIRRMNEDTSIDRSGEPLYRVRTSE